MTQIPDRFEVPEDVQTDLGALVVKLRAYGATDDQVILTLMGSAMALIYSGLGDPLAFAEMMDQQAAELRQMARQAKN